MQCETLLGLARKSTNKHRRNKKFDECIVQSVITAHVYISRKCLLSSGCLGVDLSLGLFNYQTKYRCGYIMHATIHT